MNEFLLENISNLGQCLLQRGWMCATAESCTGGMVGAAFTSVSGASQWFAGGIISYDNRIKTALLDVPEAELILHGAVSEHVVRRMAAGACKALQVPVAVAISGVAGPTGGSPLKPVGTVWLGFAVDGVLRAHCLHLSGDREQIRQGAVLAAVQGLRASFS